MIFEDLKAVLTQQVFWVIVLTIFYVIVGVIVWVMFWSMFGAVHIMGSFVDDLCVLSIVIYIRDVAMYENLGGKQ